MRLDRAERVGVVLLVIVCACGDSPSSSVKSGSEDGGNDPVRGAEGGSSGGGAGTPCADVLSDPSNCGSCGVVCRPLHASATCVQGGCGHGPCAAGYFDLDGDPGNGCEASCAGTACTASYGPLVLSAPPLPDTGIVAAVFASGGPVDAGSAPGPTLGILGEATPLPYFDSTAAGGSAETSNSLVVNLVGYGAALR